MCDTNRLTPETKSTTSTSLEESLTKAPQESKTQRTSDDEATTSDAATSTGSSSTDDLKERLQRLQWKTFDLHRQNELLRRMLEIQSTVNENAAAAAAASQVAHKVKLFKTFFVIDFIFFPTKNLSILIYENDK